MRFIARMSPAVRWSIWIAAFLFFTYMLVVPVDWLPPWFRFKGTGTSRFFSLGKLGHITGFATLTAFIPLLSLGAPGRLLVLAFMSSYAFLTEFVQTFVPTRTGEFTDVGIDHIGIVIGLLVGWLWPRKWKAPPVQPQQHAG